MKGGRTSSREGRKDMKEGYEGRKNIKEGRQEGMKEGR